MDAAVTAALIGVAGTLLVSILNRLTLKKGLRKNSSDHGEVTNIMTDVLHSVNSVRDDLTEFRKDTKDAHEDIHTRLTKLEEKYV
jgi:hypothetical protein